MRKTRTFSFSGSKSGVLREIGEERVVAMNICSYLPY